MITDAGYWPRRYRELLAACFNVVEFEADVNHILYRDPKLDELRKQISDLRGVMDDHSRESNPEMYAERDAERAVAL